MGTPEGGSRYEARGDDLEIKGELYLCLLVTFFVNALTSAVVTERVPINTNFSLITDYAHAGEVQGQGHHLIDPKLRPGG